MIRFERLVIVGILACACMAALGCNQPYWYTEPGYYAQSRPKGPMRWSQMDRALEDRILAINPDHVSDHEVRGILTQAPAPRIIKIHGGMYPAYLEMTSFSQFLIGMGYPEGKVRHPVGGAYSYSCYGSSEELAGAIAWYYEKEGLRPIVIGHSLGGMQTVKILHLLAGTIGDRVTVYNPVREQWENRDWIIDPVSGQRRAVVGGVKLSFACAVAAGGIARATPNQWDLLGDKLREVPDSCVEFTGFYMPGDVWGGDMGGFGSSNHYHALGQAKVRNVHLPFGYEHYTVCRTAHLVQSAETRAFCNYYQQNEEPQLTGSFSVSTMNILWAADVWTSIKRQWVLELQRVIKLKRNQISVPG